MYLVKDWSTLLVLANTDTMSELYKSLNPVIIQLFVFIKADDVNVCHLSLINQRFVDLSFIVSSV